MPTRLWRSLWLSSLLGFVVLASGCKSVVVSPEPFPCPHLTDRIINEYAIDAEKNLSPAWRAWTREADRTCRANASLIKEPNK